MQYKGVYLLYRSIAYLRTAARKIFDVVDGFGVVDCFEVFAHRLARDRYALVHYKLRFLQGQRVPLDTVAFVGVFDCECPLDLFQSLNGQRAQCGQTSL